MMLLELLSAVGDDLSYLQDRIAAEATLATATQRRLGRAARAAGRLRAAAGDLGARAGAGRRGDGERASRPLSSTAPQPDGGALAFELGDGPRSTPHTGLLRTDAAARRPAVEPPRPRGRRHRPAARALPVGRLAALPARRRDRDVDQRARLRPPGGRPAARHHRPRAPDRHGGADRGRPAGARGRPPHRRDRGDRPAVRHRGHSPDLGRERGAERRARAGPHRAGRQPRRRQPRARATPRRS